jgi:anti-sigma B factor antagonist
MELTPLPEEPAPALAVTGEVDVYEAPRLRAALFALLDEGPDRVVIDCSGMRFIDSAGLAVFVDAQRRLQPRGGTLVLRGLRSATRRIFEITALEDVFAFDD